MCFIGRDRKSDAPERRSVTVRTSSSAHRRTARVAHLRARLIATNAPSTSTTSHVDDPASLDDVDEHPHTVEPDSVPDSRAVTRGSLVAVRASIDPVAICSGADGVSDDNAGG